MKLNRLLDRRGGRAALGWILSVRLWRAHRIWVPVRWQPQDRTWLFSYPDAKVRSPYSTLSYYKYKEGIGRDAYLYHYTPVAGDVVVHVGAGSGWEAPMFSRLVGPTGRVYLIEAHPKTFQWLRRRIKAERLTNVTPINVAVSDRAGTLHLTDDQLHQFNHVSANGPVEVPAAALPAIFAAHGIDRIDLLTINIEGFEREAVRGMQPVASRIRHLAVSCHDFMASRGEPDWTRTREEVLAMLESYGYDVAPRDQSEPRDWLRDYLYATWPVAHSNG
jgi:FkbM family methyltransferase